MGRIPSVAGGLLLATKLFAPRPRADLVPRSRLVTRLNAGLATGRCSLLSAPAGAGKTSLLAAWLRRHLRRDARRAIGLVYSIEKTQIVVRAKGCGWPAPVMRSFGLRR